jgi:tetratricopeptide (TPR) repeat protein
MALGWAAPLHAQNAPNTPTAIPAGKEAAKTLFEEGLDLEKREKYREALAKYREALQLTITPGLRFHAGYCLEMVGDGSAALDEYEAADHLAGDANKLEVHNAVIGRIEVLRDRLAVFTFKGALNLPGLVVEIDGKPYAAAQLSRVFHLNAGTHVVTAHAPGYEDFLRKIDLFEHMQASMDLHFERIAREVSTPAPAAPVPAADEAPNASSSIVLPLATTGAAVVFAAGGFLLFSLSASEQSDAQAKCAAVPTCASERSKIQTFDALAIGSFVGAAVWAGASAALWMSRGNHGTTSIKASPNVGGASLRFEGSF